MTNAPVVVFVYNREDKARKTLESLNNNYLAKDTELFIFSDGPKNEIDAKKVDIVREYINDFSSYSNFKKIEIIESEKNKGLAKSIISGVTKIIREYKRVIVIEDDLVCTNNLLNFMNDSLNFYQSDKRIWSISGYTYPLEALDNYCHDIYYTYRGCSWGWATWEDRWNTVNWDMDYFPMLLFHPSKILKLRRAGSDLHQMLYYQYVGKVDSWAVRWVYNQTQQDKYTVYPKYSFIYNIGLDGSGTHKVGDGNDNYSNLVGHEYKLENVDINKYVNKEFLNKYNEPLISKIKGILSFLYRKLKALM